MKNNIGRMVAGAAVAGSLLLSGVAFAQAPESEHALGSMGRAPVVFGTVTVISGNTLTVASKKGFGANQTATTTYTVNAASATVTKNGSASSLGAITTGDTVMIQGTVSGTNVIATTIRDGVGRGMMEHGDVKPDGTPQGKPQSIIKGNGQPVVGGSVTAVNGSTLTITNKSNVVYTVNAASTTVAKNNTASTVSAIAIGDNVIVQGTVNGTSITASSIIDSGTVNTSPGDNTSSDHKGGMGGIMGGIGNFFHKLFGFF